jgi:hypothetical protein
MTKDQILAVLCGNALGHYTCSQLTGKDWDAMDEATLLELISETEWEPLEGFPAKEVLDCTICAADSQYRVLDSLGLLKVTPDVFTDTYRTVAVSTGHLSDRDKKILNHEARNHAFSTVAERPMGYFLKLPENFDDIEENYFLRSLSSDVQMLISFAIANQFSCIEFDCDAPPVDGYHYYEG